MEVLSEFTLGDMVATFVRHQDTVGLEILPLGSVRARLEAPEPLIQVSFRGEAASGGFAAGHTLRGGSSLASFRFRDQRVDRSSPEFTVTTVFDAAGAEFRHVLQYRAGQRGFRVRTEVTAGRLPFVLEMLSSFTLGGLSPLAEGTKPLALTVHRFRSTWSNEARLVSEQAEDLQLEPSWARHGVRVERFGQVGSLPVRKFFPFVAVEDGPHATVWAVQLACPSSWQIELQRRADPLMLSGGLADFEFGHWAKGLTPGESFETPWAHLTVVRGGVEEAAQRLLDLVASDRGPDRLGRIPVVFNEFCSTWGRPSQDRVLSQLRVLRNRGIDVFVIDAGWYAHPEAGWEFNQGDWLVARDLFPEGLASAAQAIREAGLIPGLWFELETCGPRSLAFQNTDHLLQRHGAVITSGQRRFWDMADPWVVDYLTERVIGRLKADGFGYLKVDYNESLGVGCDGEVSLGEGLRKKLLATQEFFQRIRRELPGLVIENCASGGHRLEPSFLDLTEFSSFSDAHECEEIPVIAAHLHFRVPPWQSQIWAVIRKTDGPARVVYSLAATLLGVPCLSGDVEELSADQWALIEEGLRFHRCISPILCWGTTLLQGPRQASYRALKGWQAVLRQGTQGQALVVVHRFSGEGALELEVALFWEARVEEVYALDPKAIQVSGRTLKVRFEGPWEAVGVWLVRDEVPARDSGPPYRP